MPFSIPIAIPIPIPMRLDELWVFAKPVLLYGQTGAAKGGPDLKNTASTADKVHD